MTELNTAAINDLIDAALDISNATFYNTVAGAIVKNSSEALKENTNANNEMVDRLKTLTEELPVLTHMTDEALDHAKSLRNRVSVTWFIAKLYD